MTEGVTGSAFFLKAVLARRTVARGRGGDVDLKRLMDRIYGGLVPEAIPWSHPVEPSRDTIPRNTSRETHIPRNH